MSRLVNQISHLLLLCVNFSIKIFWKQPISNGSPILFYNIDLVENATNTSVYSAYIVVYNQEMNCEYKIESLQPDKIYK